jgi:hypothetical protein
MNNIDKKIGKVLDVVIEEDETKLTTIQQTDTVPYKDTEEDDTFQRDFEYTRENIMRVIETGQHSLEELFELARQSQNARAFEVLSGLIKNISDANKDLMELHRKRKEIDPSKEDSPHTVNQNLFVGSTADLMKMIKDVAKPDQD